MQLSKRSDQSALARTKAPLFGGGFLILLFKRFESTDTERNGCQIAETDDRQEQPGVAEQEDQQEHDCQQQRYGPAALHSGAHRFA